MLLEAVDRFYFCNLIVLKFISIIAGAFPELWKMLFRIKISALVSKQGKKGASDN